MFFLAWLLGPLSSARPPWGIGHELAHVRRRDHLVRWIEWLACVVFKTAEFSWLWRARHRARPQEKLRGEDFALEALGPSPRA